MKKRALSLFLSIVLLLSLSVPVMAANETTGSTAITKTVEDTPSSGGGSGGDDTPENTSSYEVVIPASFSLDDGDYFEITASKVEIGKRQELQVWVDYDRTFENDGYFYLKNTKNIAQKIPCTIACASPGSEQWPIITSSATALAASFSADSGISPSFNGAVKVVTAGEPSTAGSTSVAGTYSGTIYYKIQLVDF